MRSIKISSLVIATVAVFVALFKPEGLPNTVKYVIQIGMLFLALIYIFSRKTKVYDSIMLIIAIPICISSTVAYFDRIISMQSLMNCFFYMICLWAICQILVIWVKKGKYFHLINVLQRLLAIYCILSTISVFSIGVFNSATTTYLFGGKFITTYFYLLFIGLTYAKYQKKIDGKSRYKLLFGLVCVLAFAFEVYLRCTTGYIIIAFYYMLVVLPKNIRLVMSRRVVVLAAIIVSGAIPIFINGILSINTVQHFIVNILGKSDNLTNRLPIYTIYLFPLLKESLWLGHGYASSVMHLRTGVYWNAQNGLLDLLLNYGIIGIAGFMITCFKAFGNKAGEEYTWPFYSVLYSLILASTIEVSYDMMFFFVLSILFTAKYHSPRATYIGRSRESYNKARVLNNRF